MAEERGKITLFGQGEEKRDHLYIEDAVGLIGLTLTHKSVGVLNLATGVSVSFMQAAQKVAELAEGKVEIECLPRNNPITHVHFDVTATLKAFPQFKFTALDEGLRKMFEN
jgi:nucleoside-diphosphate-sugar epimerase